jgi:hypothetical protein
MTKLGFLFLGCAACWGEGPIPEAPTGVQVVLSVPPPDDASSCGPQKYIGDVSIADDILNVVFVPYFPPSCGGIQQRLDVEGAHVQLGNGERTPFVAGTSQGGATTRVAGNGAHSIWASNSNVMGGTQLIDVGGIPTFDIDIDISGGGAPVPAGAAIDATHAFVVASSGASNIDFNNPEWPCCGGGDTGAMGARGWQIDLTTQPPTPVALNVASDAELFYANSLKTALVANSSTLFYAT